MKRELCTVKEESKNSASRQRPRVPSASGAKRHFFRVSIFVFKNRLKKWGTSRTALAAKIFFFLAVVLACCSVFADCADCQAYKTQVVNDCDSLHSLIQGSLSDISSISLVSQNGANATSGSTQGNDQLSNAYFNSIHATSASLNSTLNSLDTFVTSIRSTAQSLQCNASTNTVGYCDCAEYLQTLIGLVQTCNQSVTGIATGIDSVKATLGEYNEGDDLMTVYAAVNDILNYGVYTYALLENFFEYSAQHGVSHNISEFYDVLSSVSHSLTNSVLRINPSSTQAYNYSYRKMGSTMQNTMVNLSTLGYFNNSNAAKLLSINEQIWYGNISQLASLSSLNNYAYTNTFAIATIARKLDGLTNTTSNALLDYIVEVDRPPLDGVSSQYYAHLTNEYLQAWSANDNPNTNWFRRIEILLASMAFRDSGHQDELDEIAEALPSSSDLSSLESSLDASELFDVDIGGQFFDNAPVLPDYGLQLPQTLTITIPSFGGDDSQSASTAYNVEIDVNSISSVCDAIRACFRFLWWGLVALLVFFLGRWFLKGCSLAFKLIQGIHFS